jgi:hypothetical protein
MNWSAWGNVLNQYLRNTSIGTTVKTNKDRYKSWQGKEQDSRPNWIKASSRLSLHYSFDTSIGRYFVSFLTCISCFYIYLVKYFNLNEKFILLKNSSDRVGLELFIKTRIGFGLDNFGNCRIINVQSDPMHLYCACIIIITSPELILKLKWHIRD